MTRRTALLIVAIVIAVLGAAMIVVYVKGIDARAAEGQELVKVLHAAERIQPGQSLESAKDAGQIEEREVRRVDVVHGALTTVGKKGSEVALITIQPGQQVLGSMFGDEGVAAPAASGLKLRAGEVALSVSLRDRNRVAAFVTPGSRIALYLSTEIPGRDAATKAEPYTTLLLPEVTVLGVGASTTPGKKQKGDLTAADEVVFTLAIDQDRVEDVIFGARNTELTFALLGEGTKLKVGKGVRLRDVVPNAFGGRR